MVRYAVTGLVVLVVMFAGRAFGQPPASVPTPMSPTPLQFPTPGTTPGQPTNPQATPQPPAPAADDSLLANASARGTEAEATAFPTVFGDLLGGGGIAGPLPALQTLTGQLVSPPVIVVLPNGQRVQVAGPMAGQGPTGLGQPVDDLIRAPASQILGTPATGASSLAQLPPGTPVTPVGVLPPPGTRFDESLAPFVARVPLFTRGAFKITENDTPRPTTRAYMSYSFYDQVFKSFGGPGTPRATLHQQMFGLEYANTDRTFSVGVRLPYNQYVAPGLFSNTGLGDLTLIGKAVLYEDRCSGSLFSGGLAITVPTGELPFASTTTGDNPRGTLIQPWLGHIVTRGDWFTQGFNAIVIPTDADDVTFLSNDMSFGYFARRAPGEFLSAVVPVVESHTNVPLNRVGTRTEPVGFVTTVTILGGVQMFFRDRVGLGFAAGAPVTGPRPFSLQSTVALNAWF